PTLVRIAFVVATMLGGVGIAAYVAALLLVPEEGSDEAIIHTARSGRAPVILGIVLLRAGVATALSTADIGFHGGLIWALPRARCPAARARGRGRCPRRGRRAAARPGGRPRVPSGHHGRRARHLPDGDRQPGRRPARRGAGARHDEGQGRARDGSDPHPRAR